MMEKRVTAASWRINDMGQESATVVPACNNLVATLASADRCEASLAMGLLPPVARVFPIACLGDAGD
jgi:hypothetical protein